MTFKNQRSLFEHIWATREHVSEINGEQLPEQGHWQWHWNFAHILNKGSYPSAKLVECNIVLLTPAQHQLFDFHPHKVKNLAPWIWLFEERELLKIRYHNKEFDK